MPRQKIITDNTLQSDTAVMHQMPATEAVPNGSMVTLRVPKPNIQVLVLGLVAFITLFQTYQLLRVSNKAAAMPLNAAPAAVTTSTTGTTGTAGSNADVPQSMVGGC